VEATFRSFSCPMSVSNISTTFNKQSVSSDKTFGPLCEISVEAARLAGVNKVQISESSPIPWPSRSLGQDSGSEGHRQEITGLSSQLTAR
jgi:hypothetical protein